MKYDYQINVDDSYILDNEAKSDGTPYLSNAVIYDCTSNGDRLTIGGTVSNKLTVFFHNPPTTNFDGLKLELSIKEVQEQGDDGADVSITVSDIDQFLDDMETITDGTNGDTGADITFNDIGRIESDPSSTTDNYEIVVDGESGENTEVPTNENYRGNGSDIVGEASADTETLTDWVKFGTYFVTSYRKIDDDTYEVTALDGFVLMGDIFTPTITSGTIADYYDDFSSQLSEIDILVNDEVFPDAEINWTGEYSFRDAAGYFATFLGGYATFGREGYLDIRPYLKSDEVIPFYSVYDSEHTANMITVNAVACDRIPSASATDYITLGEDDTIEMEFVNPFMTETLLQNVLDVYLYTMYQPCIVTCDYKYGLQSGDFVQLENNDGEIEWICITNQVINLDGGIVKISSLGNSSTLATNKNISKTMRNIIDAGKTATNYITEDSTGALVIRRDTDNYNVRIDADSLEVRQDERVLASFGEDVYIAPKSEWEDSNNGAISMTEGRISMGNTTADWLTTQPLFDLNVESDDSGEKYTETLTATSSLDFNPNRVITTKPVAAVISAYNNTKSGYITLGNYFAYLNASRETSTIYFNTSATNYPADGDSITVIYRTIPNTLVLRGDIVAENIYAQNTLDSGWLNLAVNTSKFKLYSTDTPIKYRRIGKIVEVRGAVSPKSSIAGSSNENIICTLPTGFRPSVELRYVCHGSGRYKWLCRVKENGVVSFERYAVVDSYATADTSAWLPFNFTFMVD